MCSAPRCCHSLLKGVTHDGSATQNCTPFLRGFKYISKNFTPFSRGFKYILRNFYPYFARKQVQFSLKNNPFFRHFKYTFADTPLFQPNQEQAITSVLSLPPFLNFEYTLVENFHPFFTFWSTRQGN